MLSENIIVKHYNIMNSKKTNLTLIENITVQVPNTASVSKDILFHVSKFLEKMMFQLMFEKSFFQETKKQRALL